MSVCWAANVTVMLNLWERHSCRELCLNDATVAEFQHCHRDKNVAPTMKAILSAVIAAGMPLPQGLYLNVFNNSSNRSFCSGNPTLTRRCRGMP